MRRSAATQDVTSGFENMDIQGLIQAAGGGSRLGLGPKAFVTLGGQTLLERAVNLLLECTDSVIVAVPPADLARAHALVAGPRTLIMSGGKSRSQTTLELISQARAPWLVLHDVVHPFARPELIASLLAQAQHKGAAAPGLLNAEFIYARDGKLLHAPGDVLVGQKPVVFSRAAALAGYEACSRYGLADDPSFLDILKHGGVHTTFVPGSATNIKITTPDDLKLAQALVAVGAG